MLDDVRCFDDQSGVLDLGGTRTTDSDIAPFIAALTCTS